MVNTKIIIIFFILFINQILALRCKCTSNGFNSNSNASKTCCNNQNGKNINNIVGNYLGCESNTIDRSKFSTCCKEQNSNLYGGCSVL